MIAEQYAEMYTNSQQSEDFVENCLIPLAKKTRNDFKLCDVWNVLRQNCMLV